MSAVYATIFILAFIILPLPLAWVAGKLFPHGASREHITRLREFVKAKFLRLVLCGIAVVALFIIAPDNALQVLLIGGAILVGWFLARLKNS